MSMTRRWTLLTAVLIVGILAASWFLLVSPKRSDAADLRTQETKQQQDNDALVAQLNVLKSQQLDLPKQKAQLAVLGKEIPNNPALPTLVRSLSAAGKKVGVTIVSMKPGTPTGVVAPVPVAPVAAPAATDTASPPPATGSDGAAPVPVAPVAPVPTLYVVPLSLEVTGSYFEIEQFINKLEGMQRKFLLSGFLLKPGAAAATPGGTSVAAGDLDLSLTGQVFLAPNISTAAVAPVAAPAQ
jgi:Tfp pilus assembly protein PilO